MLRVTEADYLDGFRVRLSFNDGVRGVVDLRERLDGPIFLPLNNPDTFRQFELTDHTLAWPNGADFAPEYLHDLVVQADSTNHPMQRSGEIGFVEMENISSPPADR